MSNVLNYLKFLLFSLVSLLTIYLFTVAVITIYYLTVLETPGYISLKSPDSKHFIIDNKDLPSSYGFNNYEEVTYPSTTENIKLSGWYIPSKVKSNKSIVFVHGWAANRLSTLKFLEIFKNEKIADEYSFLILDLRNSGNSSPATTDLGIKASYDLFSAIKYLKLEKGVENITIFGISMGAMATIAMLNNENLKNELQTLGIRVNKLIFDSPLANASDSIKQMSTHKIPNANLRNIILKNFLFLLNKRWSGNLEKLKFSRLIPGFDVDDIFILQSEKDSLTSAKTLRAELDALANKPNIHYFKLGKHTRIFDEISNKVTYKKLVLAFIKGKND